ncbi:MAG: 16S rRNA (cytosine(1402)-N(4))-methyltransferase RsmH [Candidatus Nomurabacteria bacterium]|jgi:16S rRNA (cytosine1402-N4)-methyltransferase|nr:16S rRNA (cytosine(1402)-N(4))-methyltransferase RsmH [Candidatus Nomurabacteria bacterium]
MELHKPVMLNEVLAVLQPKSGESYLDLTAGYAGHAKAILGLTENYKHSVLVDRDAFAIAHLRFLREKGANVMKNDFYGAALKLLECGNRFDMILMDLGVSSPQFDLKERGFSFAKDGKLDMRMDGTQELTAERVVNHFPKQKLMEIFVKYGEENPKFAGKIAEAIVRQRPISGTLELAELIKSKTHAYQKTHPATRIFQALRIFVNDEIGELEKTLPLVPELLLPAGRVAIISFHSLEDRKVKEFLKTEGARGLEARLRVLTKTPMVAGELEISSNPRARSAKLRAAARV